MIKPINDEGLLRKISGQELTGKTGIVWNMLDFYWSLEAIGWLIFGGILAVKGVGHLISWLF